MLVAPAAILRVIRHRLGFVYVLAAVALLGIGVHLGLGLAVRAALGREYGPIENATVALYGLAALWLALGRFADRRAAWLAMAVVLLLGARELDLNTALTTGNLTKLAFYLDPEMPAGEKLAGLGVIAFCLWVALRCLRAAPQVLGRLRAGEPFAWTLAALAVYLPLAKLFDGVHRVIRWRQGGRRMPQDDRLLLGLTEEILELALPLLILLAIAQYLAAARRRAATPACGSLSGAAGAGHPSGRACGGQ